MLEAARRFDRGFTAFSATLVTLHSELILALPGNRQIRELVSNAVSHDRTNFDRTLIICESSISMTEISMIDFNA
jgi:hypothetical protein